MNCASCGAALPAGAMFCGRCGRAVNAAPVPRARVIDPRPGDTTILIPSTLSVRQGQVAADAADAAGAPGDADVAATPAGAGSANGEVTAAPRRDGDVAGREGESAGPDGDVAEPDSATTGPDGGAAEVEGDTPGVNAESPVDAYVPVRNPGPPDSSVGSADAVDRVDRFEPSRSDVSAGLAYAPGAVSESLIATRPAAIVTSGHDGGVATGTAVRGGSAPESSAHQPPVPYVLSFSTGERVIVVGSGLLGRRPYVQPGESFDQLVSIADYERSVSKTHLEFGIEDGDLWICDRYSANGTVIIPPSGAPHRLEPGRRYRVPRAGRVEIGDRWFDVR